MDFLKVLRQTDFVDFAQCGELTVEDEILLRTIDTYELDVLKNDDYETGIK